MLDRNSATPLYAQIENKLRLLLGKEPYINGEYLPGENELMTIYNVSRHTIRHALGVLVREGLIIREKGRGTRRNNKPKLIATHIESWASFSTEMVNMGFNKTMFLLKTDFKTAPSEVNQIFKVDNQTKLPILIRQYGYTDTQHTDIYFESYFSLDLNLETNEDFINNKIDHLYQFLKDNYNITPLYSEETIEVCFSKDLNQNFKKIFDNTILVKRSRVVYDTNNNPFEYNIGYYRHDKFSFKIHSEYKK